MKTNYECIIDVISSKTDVVFAYPGHNIIPFLDFIEKDGRLKLFVSASEWEAVLSADAYSRYKGFGVAIVTYGVGSMSAMTPMMNTIVSGSPTLIISGSPSMHEWKQGNNYSSVNGKDDYVDMLKTVMNSFGFINMSQFKAYFNSSIGVSKPLFMELSPSNGYNLDSDRVKVETFQVSEITNDQKQKFFNIDFLKKFVNMELRSIELPKIPNNMSNYYLTIDVGESLISGLDLSRFIPNDHIITPMPMVSMNVAMGLGIGTSVAVDRPVIVICGDGSFRLSAYSLSTIKRYNLDVRVLVLNNNGFQTERYLSENAETAGYNNLEYMNYGNLVNAYGIKHVPFKTFFSTPGPSIHIYNIDDGSARLANLCGKAIKDVI